MQRTILLVDDDESVLIVLREFLQIQGHDVLTADNGTRAWELIRSQAPDLVICDWMLPGLDGLEICRRVKTDPALRGIYMVLITARDGQEDKVQGLEAGADDFLGKPIDLSELRARLASGLRLVEYQRSLQTMALTDEMTGLFNWRAFQTILQKEIERSRRYKLPLSLLVIDVDRFTQINDRLGHALGDLVLQLAAERILRVLRCSDMAFRTGGDEFAAALLEEETGARAAARRLREAFEEVELSLPGGPERVTVSVGVAICLPDDSRETLYRRADAEMYAAKHGAPTPAGGAEPAG